MLGIAAVSLQIPWSTCPLGFRMKVGLFNAILDLQSACDRRLCLRAALSWPHHSDGAQLSPPHLSPIDHVVDEGDC